MTAISRASGTLTKIRSPAALTWKLLLAPSYGVLNYYIGQNIVWLGQPVPPVRPLLDDVIANQRLHGALDEGRRRQAGPLARLLRIQVERPLAQREQDEPLVARRRIP